MGNHYHQILFAEKLPGYYRALLLHRGMNPTQHCNCLFFTVREQRAHCRW